MTEQELSQQSVPPSVPPVDNQNNAAFADQDMYAENVSDDSSGFMLPNQPEPEYLIIEWLADSRLSQRRSKEYYSSLAVIVLLVSLILFFANQVLLIFVLVSFLFVTYVLAVVKPDTIHNMITSYGIRYRDQLYYWQQLGRFWVSEHRGKYQIHIEGPVSITNQIILLPANERSPIEVNIEDVVDVLSRYLVYEEPNPTQIDRWVQWLEAKFPLETSKKDAEFRNPSEVRQSENYQEEKSSFSPNKK